MSTSNNTLDIRQLGLFDGSDPENVQILSRINYTSPDDEDITAKYITLYDSTNTKHKELFFDVIGQCQIQNTIINFKDSIDINTALLSTKANSSYVDDEIEKITDTISSLSFATEDFVTEYVNTTISTSGLATTTYVDSAISAIDLTQFVTNQMLADNNVILNTKINTNASNVLKNSEEIGLNTAAIAENTEKLSLVGTKMVNKATDTGLIDESPSETIILEPNTITYLGKFREAVDGETGIIQLDFALGTPSDGFIPSAELWFETGDAIPQFAFPSEFDGCWIENADGSVPTFTPNTHYRILFRREYKFVGGVLTPDKYIGRVSYLYELP